MTQEEAHQLLPSMRDGNTTMTRKQLQGILLALPELIFLRGAPLHVASRHLGAGVYKVWYEPWKVERRMERLRERP